jgi:hypothetical protein
VLSQGVTIIDDFYKKCIADMHPAVRRLIEDRLLTTAGYRDNIDLAEARATLERAGTNSSYIDDLVRLRLLQIEDHRGVPRLELTHDVLAEPVKHSRDDWKKAQLHEAAQQQERDALLRAKEAEQEALKRTHFLQKMVAAAASVSLLLAGVVVYGIVERKQAKSNAARAQQSQKAAEQSQEMAEDRAHQAVQLKLQAQQEATIADLNERKAEDNAKKADQSTLQARASAKEALQSKDATLGMQKQLTGLSSDILTHCVRMYNEFDTAAKNEKDDAGKDAVRELYEQLLMGNGQCLDLAQKAHGVDPANIDYTDSLTMIPVRAAASAAYRHANPQLIREQVNKDFEIAQKLSVFQNEIKNDVTQIELARTYLSFAYILSYLHDDSAQAIADKGLNILANLRTQAKSNGWNYYEWDILGEANNWYAIYLQGLGKNADAIAPLTEAFNDEKRASDLAPKEKPYYASELLYRSLVVANAERDLGSSDDATVQSYQQSLTIAKQQNDKAKITEIYTDMRVVLVREKKYDEALALLGPRIQSLLASPQDTQRDQDLAQAYRDAAQVEETRMQWVQGAAYRTHVVEVLAAMKPDAYADQRTDLIFAYSVLSWAEIFAAQVDKGIADAQKAINLSMQTEGHPGLSESYDNGVKALSLNKRYDDAHKLLEQRIQSLLGSPKSTQRERDLAAAYTSSAELEEATKQWVQGAAYRAHTLEVLAALKPDDYDNQRSDLIFAYSLLSWDEIFAGQVEKGIADTQKAISLSKQTEEHTGLNTVYENGVNALSQNSKYDEAESLLDAFSQTLLASPSGIDREREIATVVDADKARIAETRKQWLQAVNYRSDAVKRLSALDPKAYDGVKADLVSAYGSLSFEQEEAGNFVEGVEAAKAGIKLDPSQSWIEENEANGLLLSGRADEAKTLYMKVKDIQWQGAPMTSAIADDLHTFCKLGYARPDMAGIAHDLGITNADLYSCLAAAAKTDQRQ